jgi:hypothetical protein
VVIPGALPFSPVQVRTRAGLNRQTELPGTAEITLASSAGTAVANIAD